MQLECFEEEGFSDKENLENLADKDNLLLEKLFDKERECKSQFDPVFIEDERVLKNLLRSQQRYTIQQSYFKCLQPDLSPSMRTEVALWLLEVCEEEKCQDDVFTQAMMLLDRFLAIVPIKRSQLQLAGSASLFISCKFRQTKPLFAERLIMYTDYSITIDELRRWELLILSQLSWEVAAPTPNDFLNLILRRVQTKDSKMNLIKKHAETLISLCATDFEFSLFPPSVIATACIATASTGMKGARNSHESQQDTINKLCSLTSTNFTELIAIQETIKSIVKETKESVKK